MPTHEIKQPRDPNASPRDLVMKLMTTLTQRFHHARVKAFFEELDSAGFVIVPKPVNVGLAREGVLALLFP
jgi:hypothetical protein